MTNEMMNDSELETVSGGVDMRNYRFSGEVTPESCVVGQSYYAVLGGTWYYGQLAEISSRTPFPGKTDLCFTFHTTMQNGLKANMKVTLNAAQIQLYTKLTMNA